MNTKDKKRIKENLKYTIKTLEEFYKLSHAEQLKAITELKSELRNYE